MALGFEAKQEHQKLLLTTPPAKRSKHSEYQA